MYVQGIYLWPAAFLVLVQN